MANYCVPGEDLVLIASSIAVSLANGRSTDEVNVLGNLLQAIGENLSLIASQRSACEGWTSNK
ncbi:hypothetical protein [Clostridium minihomine]|uniref:hypothetical protein n=1 Tax=Clostridium minihomine TaxID=2045012 RepID=UPI000C79539A|nr:hypothetical protein [Clostridium minihomine]